MGDVIDIESRRPTDETDPDIVEVDGLLRMGSELRWARQLMLISVFFAASAMFQTFILDVNATWARLQLALVLGSGCVAFWFLRRGAATLVRTIDAAKVG